MTIKLKINLSTFSAVLYLISLVFTNGCSSIGAAPSAAVEGIPDKDPIGHALKMNSNKFESCGRDSISIQTGSVQKMKLKFKLKEVENRSQAFGIDVELQEGPDPDLIYCITKAVKSIKFPRTKEPSAKVFVFPVTLRSP